LSDGSKRARFETFVALYRPSCEHKLADFTYQSIPAYPHVLLVRYDVETRKKQAWYHYTSRFDLFDRYAQKLQQTEENFACPTIIHHPLSDFQNFEIWQQQESFSKWVYSKLFHQIRFVNLHDRPVDLYFRSQTHRIRTDEKILPGKWRQQDTFLSHIFVVLESDTNQFVDGFVLQKNDSFPYYYIKPNPDRQGDFVFLLIFLFFCFSE